jgi:hypothetical protein
VSVNEETKPWAKIARSARHLKQSFSQLKAESSRSAREACQPIPQFPLRILDSDDLLVILNARATVLLNISFRNRSQSRHIVTLSSLARFLFSVHRIESDRIGGETSQEERAWMIRRMLQLIRDDVYQLLTYASQEFIQAEREEQQRHLDAFCTSAMTWQNLINRQIKSARGHSHRFESGEGFPDRMATLRAKCERWCSQLWVEESAELCESNPYTWNRSHDTGAEWTGPLLSDNNDRAGPKLIAVPWLERREDGYWLKVQVDQPPEPQLNLEEVQKYSGRTITESKRRNCKHSLPNVAKHGEPKRLS